MLFGYIEGREHSENLEKVIVPQNKLVGTWEYEGIRLIPYSNKRNETIKNDYSFLYHFDKNETYSLVVNNKLEYTDKKIEESKYTINGLYTIDGDYITLEPQYVLGKTQEDFINQLRSQNSQVQIPDEGLREFQKYEMVYYLKGDKLTLDSPNGKPLTYTKVD